MKNLELNKELYFEIVGWMNAKGYSYRTVKEYSRNLKWYFKKYSLLNDDSMKKSLRYMKHPNQRAIFNIINRYCSDNNIPFNIIVPIIKQKPRKLPDILTPEEIEIMIKSCPKPHDLMLRCIYGIGAGLRVSEIIKLCWFHIRWAEWLKNRQYGVCIIKDAKRGQDRVVNIPNEIMEELYQLASGKNILNEFRIPTGNMIFPIKFGKFKKDLMINNQEQWRNEYIKQAEDWIQHNIIKKYCRKALNKNVHLHQLRHSRATHLYENEGIPIERISQLLGHKDLKTTMIYTRVDPKSTFEMMRETKVI